MDLAVAGRAVHVLDRLKPACVHISGGSIAEIAPLDHHHPQADTLEIGDSVLLPGLVDTHVHVNQPGRTHWEGFETATRAAGLGGTTTLVDMPLNAIPPTTTPAALAAKRAEAAGEVHVDVGFWGGLVPGNLDQLEPLARSGACGFKAFLVDSGVEEFPPVDLAYLEAALAVLARLNLPLLVHAEDPALIRPAPAGRGYRTYLDSRREAAEQAAVEAVIRAAARTGGRVHVLHLAAAGPLESITRAKAAGIRITAETCPHYLFFSGEEIPDGATVFKCAPPIRERHHRDGLWRGLEEGAIDMVVSDHSPAPPEIKELESGDFGRAWGGISSVQLRLAVTWTEGRARGWDLARLVPKLAAAPARLAGLEGRKGVLAPGADADLVLLDADASFVVDPARLAHRHPLTPYAERELRGVVREVWLRGERLGEDPRGRLLSPAGPVPS